MFISYFHIYSNPPIIFYTDLSAMSETFSMFISEVRPSIYGRGLKYHFIPAHLNLRSLRNLKTSCLRFSSATTTPPLPQSFSAVIGRPVWFSTNGRSWLAHMTAGLYCGQTGRQVVGLTKLLLLLGRAFFKENKTISDGGITVDFSIIKVHTSN